MKRFIFTPLFLLGAALCFGTDLSFTGLDGALINQKIPDININTSQAHRQKDWYKHILLPWAKKNMGRPFSVKDPELEKYHSFNIEFFIRKADGGEAACSSTRIHKDWLVTAAHCLDAVDTYYIIMKDKSGKEHSIKAKGVYYLQGRKEALKEAQEAYRRLNTPSMGLDDVLHIILSRVDSKYDFVLINIIPPQDEERTEGWPPIVSIGENSKVEKNLFVVAKYGGSPKYSGVVPLKFKSISKKRLSDKENSVIVTNVKDCIGGGHSGTGLLGGLGLYGVFTSINDKEAYTVYYSKEHITFMQQAMGKDFNDLTIIYK